MSGSAPASGRPILDGPLRDEALRRVLEIAAALSEPYDRWALTQRPEETGLRAISLALGRSGLAVFFAWLARTGLHEGSADRDRAMALLETSIELLPETHMDASALCGFPSVAWATEHVLRVLEESTDEDLLTDIDEALLDGLRDPTFVPAYDLIDGLAGHGVYALERQGRDLALPLIEAVLDRWEGTACPQDTGISWPSGQMTRTAQGKDVEVDETYFNLGMSHGVPGVIGCLSRFAAVSEARTRALALLRPAVAWIREQAIGNGTRTYPDFVAPDVDSEPARVAWCYGDPGVAASLCAAATALDDDDLRDFTLDVARAAASRRDESTGIVDDGLCHGRAGVAHAFSRLYEATGDEHCRDAALYWFSQLLERKEQVPHVAGFTTFCFERERDGEYIEDPAWLTGAAGVGLVLISAITGSAPDWDRPLLLDLG